MKFAALLLFVSLALISCKSNQSLPVGQDPMASHVDSTISPGADFFTFANGAWFKSHPIPASEQSNGLWQMIQDTINEQIRNICVSAAGLNNEPKGSDKQKIGDFYYSGMDSTSLNKRKLSDILPDLKAIDAITDLQGLARESARLRPFAGSVFFGFYIFPDDRISSKNAIRLQQGGLSLFDRSYYLDMDERSVSLRKDFESYASKVFMLLGYEKKAAEKAAGQLLRIETSLATSSRKIEDTRDPLTNYNKVSLDGLNKLSPDFNWTLFMQDMGLKAVDSVIIGQTEFFTALNRYFKTYSVTDWKDYLKFHYFNGLAQYLDDKSYAVFFDFYGKTLSGVPEPKPRWKRVVEQTDGSLGELIGKVYVAEYLPKGTKEKLLEIGEAIRVVYAERIKTLDWMSPETKEKALDKLSGIVMKVGYPDQWKDLSALEISRESYTRNVMNALKWQFDYMIAKYGKPVDRTEWDMYPQTYNAYYNPSNNEICVPGCNILVLGYEHVMADDAILYSIIGGSTFGHEITHGFDDQGCKYDKLGNLNNWWTSTDSANFFTKTRLIVEQFNEFVAVDKLHVNGEMTQGENIADLAGISMGYEAFKKTDQFKKSEKIGGFSPDQRFFLGYALAWMINMRPEALINLVKSDVHSPPQFRVNGPLANIPEFHNAFGVKEGDAMWRPEAKRVKIW